MTTPTKAANDDIKARCEALQRRAHELAALHASAGATAEVKAAAIAEVKDILAELAQITADSSAEAAALKRQIIELGGRTIRRVVKDKDGNDVIF